LVAMKTGVAPPEVVEGLLKELIGARKALRLYPATNPLAVDWLQRLHRAVEKALAEASPLRLRVTHTGFDWDGGQLPCRDRTLEALRFELATRKLTEIAFATGVEVAELRDFLIFLNGAEEGGAAEPQAFEKSGHIGLGGSLDRYHKAEGVATAPGGDLLEVAVNELLDALQARFREITDERLRLAAWLAEVGRAGDPSLNVARAARGLIPLIEEEPDRDLRYRTLIETLMGLTEPLRTAVIGAWLVPTARTDLDVVRLLGRFSGDDFAELAKLLPEEALYTLRADVEASPAEEWMKARICESLGDALTERESAAPGPAPVIATDDPSLLPLREVLRESSVPDRVLRHSVAVLRYLVSEAESEQYPLLVVDALEEAIGDALSLGRLDLALDILRWYGRPDGVRPEWQGEHRRRHQALLKRASGRATATRLVELLRGDPAPANARDAGEFLRLVGREAFDEFLDLAGEEPAGSGPGVLAALEHAGEAAVPAIKSRLSDRRWALVRNLVTILGRLGDGGALDAITSVVGHAHPQVRREAARVLPALGPRAVRWLLGLLTDADLDVRRAALKGLQSLVDTGNAPAIRDYLTSPTRTVADVLVKRELITMLASTGRPETREILHALGRRWAWPWQRYERQVRALARDAVRSTAPAAAGAPGASTPPAPTPPASTPPTRTPPAAPTPPAR
jgi:hypothetical protein